MSWFRLFLAAILALGVGATSPAAAQSYPDKPITLVVPFAAGGPMDTMARLVASNLTQKLKQNVIVENRAGAGGTLGARAVLAAPPDGYMLLWGSSGTLAIAPALYKDQNYDPSPLVPVALVAKLPHVLVVPADLPVKSVKDLVDYIKANPGKVNFGASLGTPPHLMGVLFTRRAGVDATFIPYKGAAPSIVDLLAGRTQFTFDALTVLASQIAEGKLRALAVVSDTRWPPLANVPTMVESGFPGFNMVAYSGVLAPAGTPRAIVDKLNAAINEGLTADEAKATLAKFSAVAQPGSPQDFAAYIKTVGPTWAELVEISGASVQ
jgi:tripartite-type tricarboxylate transporter receptor subunit TctC